MTKKCFKSSQASHFEIFIHNAENVTSKETKSDKNENQQSEAVENGLTEESAPQQSGTSKKETTEAMETIIQRLKCICGGFNKSKSDNYVYMYILDKTFCQDTYMYFHLFFYCNFLMTCSERNG
ncbi:hypothetical protein KUTeg_023408 [Tegillarca granosa]|uniref:Uncharacterized protein n=1 Tax=Tegillarca granosa TaxID=220873 RepID=A0ABQ9E1K8_TEGGR|nr:hypothetical protein KUTeg_023408 [Tegillarca granosa]